MDAPRSYGGTVTPLAQQHLKSMMAAFADQSHCVTVDFDSHADRDTGEVGYAVTFGTGVIDITRQAVRRVARV